MTLWLLRFDDVCPTMNWRIWDELEKILLEFQVEPLLAVVPENRDDNLNHSAPNYGFWDRVRTWQYGGWSIGMHGYQHRYVTRDAGLLGINPFSEFAGLSAEAQEEKIRLALAIFRREGIRPDAWVAPGHSFDATTVTILKRAGFAVISDGFSILPARDRAGVIWVPQQLWRFRRFPFGVWTVAHHINTWDLQQVSHFRWELKRYSHAICGMKEIVARYGGRQRQWTDVISSRVLGSALRWKVRASQYATAG